MGIFQKIAELFNNKVQEPERQEDTREVFSLETVQQWAKSNGSYSESDGSYSNNNSSYIENNSEYEDDVNTYQQEMYDKYYELNENLKKEKDVLKRIKACEELYKILPEYVRASLEEDDILQPSILCRDCGPDLYMRIGDWDKAKKTIEFLIDIKAYDLDEGNCELESLKIFKEVSEDVLNLLKDNPGFLQKDIYKKLNVSEDYKGIYMHFLQNSLLIHKEEYKSTYKLYVNSDGAENARRVKKVIIPTDINNLPFDQNAMKESGIAFPDWYVSLSFGKTTSNNYQKAIMMAKAAPQYYEQVTEGNILHQAIYSSKANEYLAFVMLYELVGAWKSAFVIINGNLTDRKVIRQLNYCYGDKCRFNDKDFCFGASKFTANPFGCHRLQISFCNNPWWTYYGKYGNKWKLDKEKMKLRINDVAIMYKACPCFNYNNIIREVDKLPDEISESKLRELEASTLFRI